jgi:hypothetical protein
MEPVQKATFSYLLPSPHLFPFLPFFYLFIYVDYLSVCLCLMSYVFVGAGFPMHRDLIWSIVRPL